MATIGIAMAVYKPNPDFYLEQLQSIQAQTWTDWICVMTSDSPLHEILQDSRLEKFKVDPRFVWLENPSRLGHKKNFERAIQEVCARGVAMIACSDQDDVWYSDKLAVLLEAFQKAGPLSLVHSDLHVLTPRGREERTAWQIEMRGVRFVRPEHLFVRNVVTGCSMCFDAELARRFPEIPSGAEYHDHWYALVASFHGGVHPVPRPLLAYRQHGANEVGVSPFRGRFYLKRSDLGRFFKKSKNGWVRSRNLASSAKKAGLPLTGSQEGSFVKSGDFGLGLFIVGLGHFFSDPPLARACFIRCFGKISESLC